MKDIAVFGAGSYGEEIACLIKKINQRISRISESWNFIGFFDDDESLWNIDRGYGKILGGLDALNSWATPLSVCIAIANVSVLKEIVGRITNSTLDFPNIIDPDTSFLDIDSVSLGIGNVIGEGCRLAPKVQIGNFNIIVNDSILGHDVCVGNYNVFYPAVRLSGHVTVGDCNLLGVRSTVLQGFSIGSNVKLASGSLLMNNAKDGFVYRGNPARKMIM